MATDSDDISTQPNPAEKLTRDSLVQIMSRVPYKSLCRFKCVCRRWRSIISHPDHRKALAQYHLQALAGFFCRTHDHNFRLVHNFATVSVGGRPIINPSRPFLPNCGMFNIADSCNGLLLCRCFATTDSLAFTYVVCNPATEKWVVLPGWFKKIPTARLGFDPAVSSHFHVFQFVEHGVPNSDGLMDAPDVRGDGHVQGVGIYSSKTGVWSHKDNGLELVPRIVSDSKSVFVNGFLHLLAMEFLVLAVDVEGTTWRVIPLPHDDYEDALFINTNAGFIDLSQGCLYFANSDDYEECKLSIWVLEDYNSEVWVLKHNVRYWNLFGVNVYLGQYYHIVAIHPERSTIFLVYGHGKVLMSYEMDSGKVQFIHDLGHVTDGPYIPYVPLYSESLADGY
ncbi:F-box protein At5g07610-like [Lolium perenne]|uniref:F-box protein At5g07610-like n=1 Tax=Lolium perenne TaxID=4522 RepID=UPI0021EA469E|nr:F-box protein At5g07610-like [Lolium perenne]